MSKLSFGENSRWFSTRSLFLASLTLLVLVSGVIWWVAQRDIGIESKQSLDNEVSADFVPDEGTDHTLVISEDEIQQADTEEFDPAFTPETTILNVNCKMLAGEGAAEDVAVVTLLSDDRAKFAVLDANGTLFSDTLDFQPDHFRIGRRPDGSVIVGFANFHHTGLFGPLDTDEPVRIYHDGHVIYETNEANEIDIAHDGSSFFVWKPSPANATRLVVRNMEDGTQKEIELGTRFWKDHAYYPGTHTPEYSDDSSEIMFVPARRYSTGSGVYWIYPVGQGRSRRVTTEDYWEVHLTSSENGYFVEHPYELMHEEMGVYWNVKRMKLDPSTGSVETLWSRELNERYISRGGIDLSQNGNWLGISAGWANDWEYNVLDTETGETIFRFPYKTDSATILARLKPILPENATMEDVGEYRGMNFVGNSLLTYRSRGNNEPCMVGPEVYFEDSAEWRECMRELRLEDRYRTFYDVYEMDTIELESSPSYRIERYNESSCVPAQSARAG
ncbi:MAG: hypothetical protein OXG24_11740 [Gammaproteobacteria bacterium]|nr:hypothetical protein [Gammaproteobacteria bacterium]